MSQDQAGKQESAPTAFREDDLRLYFGPNAGPYVAFWERVQASGLPFVWSWNWWGFLFPVPWLLYRKIWAVGAAVVLLPILLNSMIGFHAEAGIALATLIAAASKPLVIERAERKIRTISALKLLSQESIERLRRAGGVSRPGAVIGALLMIAVLGLALYENLPVNLPACNAPMIRSVVLDIAMDNAAATGLTGGDLKLEQVRQSGTGTDGKGRLCRAELRSQDQRLPVEYEVLWQSRGSGKFIVDLRLSED